jgi:hypothetical protein
LERSRQLIFAQSFGIGEDDMLYLKSSAPRNTAPSTSQQGFSANEAEMMRLQLLGDRANMDRLRQVLPELAQAAETDPARFRQLLPQLANLQNQAARQKETNAALLQVASASRVPD